MALNRLEEAVTAFTIAGGVAEFRERKDILSFEQFIDGIQLMLPEELREFLTKYDWLFLGPDETLTLDKIFAAMDYNRESRRDIPTHYLPIMEDQSGGFYYVVCQQVGKQAPPDFGKVMLNPGSHPRELEFKSSDFESFLISRLQFWSEDL